MFLQLANEAAVKCEPFRVTHVRRLNYACLMYASKIFFCMGIQPCIHMHSYNNFAVLSIYGDRKVFNLVRLFMSEIYFLIC